MKTGRKTMLRILLSLLLLFLVINAAWFSWRMVTYGAFSREMENTDTGSWLVPRYHYTDADGFDYGVKYPDYLSLTGNLSVKLPAEGDNPFTDALILWPEAFGGCEYGAILMEDGQEYQIYLQADGSPVDPGDKEVAARHQEQIAALLEKAQEMWDLE